MQNYEFTGLEKVVAGVTVKRIRATRDIPRHDVRAGDVGGWIESDRNLSGDAVVTEDAVVSGYAVVAGNAVVAVNAVVTDDAVVTGEVGGGA